MFVKSYHCTTSLILELAHTFWHVEITSISRINFLPILLLHVIISFKYENHFKWNLEIIYVCVFYMTWLLYILIPVSDILVIITKQYIRLL